MTITIDAHDVALPENVSIPAVSLINSIESDSDSDSISSFLFVDLGGGTGHFTVNGVPQPDNQAITVSFANLSTVQYTGGMSPGNDTLIIETLPAVSGKIPTSAPIIASTDATTGDEVPAVQGTTSNDVFHAASLASLVSFQIFRGNGGHDTAIVSNASTEFSVTYVINNTSIQNVALQPLVTDGSGPPLTEFIGVEVLQFADKTMFVENSDNANIARLYSAAFDRVPDASGLFFWEDVYANYISAAAKSAGYYASLAQTNLTSGTSIAGGFMQSSEFINKYGTLTDTAFVNAMYQNVLGRGPDQAGLTFWLNQLEHNGREVVLVGFAESPENVAKTGGDWLIAT